MFHGYSSTLEIMNKIVLSALKRDDSLFDFAYVKEFPVIGRGQYFSVQEATPPSLMANSSEFSSVFPRADITLKTWQYAAYQYVKTANLHSQTSEGLEILQACDVLNYILEDFFYDKSVTNIHLIYFAFETEKLVMVYPGGAIKGLLDFDPI